MINIIVSPKTNYLYLLLKTKKFFKYKGFLHNVLMNKQQQYCIVLNKKNIHIYLDANNKNTLKQIEHYIDYLFSNNYIGIISDQLSILHLNSVEVIPINE